MTQAVQSNSRLTASSVYIVGLIILVTTSIPAALDRGAGLPGLIITMLIMGLGVGGVKATIGPFMGAKSSTKTIVYGS